MRYVCFMLFIQFDFLNAMYLLRKNISIKKYAMDFKIPAEVLTCNFYYRKKEKNKKK